MADAYVGDVMPAPGFTSPTGTVTDDELLYSTAGFTQKGVTLAGGQGVIPLGHFLGRKTSDKKWYKYNNGASDGTEVCRGILRTAVDTGTGGAPPTGTNRDMQGNIVIQGIVKASKIVSGAGSNNFVDALTDLNARRDTVLDTFTF